ncbi:MAG: hypothetical protein V4443_10980 [Pseudomonadota bacterium]
MSKEKLAAGAQRLGFPAVFLISAAVVLWAYFAALDFPFISDDRVYLSGNLALQQLQPGELWRLLIEPYNRYEYLPLRDLSYWIELQLFGLHPAGYRIDNLILYLLCCALVYAVTLSLWRYLNPGQADSARWAAAVVTALFTIHPAHIEAVVWISGRKDLLAGMFSMLALWLALRARSEQGLRGGYAAGTLIALVAALLSKGSAVAMAPVIALLWLMFWRDTASSGGGQTLWRRFGQLLWVAAPLALAACAISIISSHSTVQLVPYWGMEIYTRALAILGSMLWLTLTPGDRHYFYPVFEDPWLWAFISAGGIVLLAAIIAALRWRTGSIASFATPAFILLCLPYLQFMPFITHTLVADRFVFLALWPIILLLVMLAWRVKAVSRAVLLCLVAMPWLVQTVERPRDWRSIDTLAAADLRAYSGSYFALFKNVETQLSAGQYHAAHQTATRISDPEIRNIAVQLVEGAYAVADEAVVHKDPRDALERLHRLDILLRQPLAQAAWNTPMFSFWLTCRNILALEWATLGKNSPEDAQVRNEVKAHQEGGF